MTTGAGARQRLAEFYKTISEDLDRCVEFWLKHSHDDKHGGYFTCLDANGCVYDTTKYTWLQSREVWMFAKLYNEMPRFHKPQILEFAKQGADFIRAHVKSKEGSKCLFSLTRDGRPVKSQRSVFSECFYTMAMAEMYNAVRDDVYKNEATAMMQQIVHWVRVDNSGLGQTIAPPDDTSSLAVPMMLLCLIDQMESMCDSVGGEFTSLAEWCVARVMAHVQRGGAVVLETVLSDGGEVDSSQGRLLNPGHAIEAGWFLLQRAMKTADTRLQGTAIQTFISASFERGWDKKHGGIFYFLDVDDRPLLQLEWDMKLWWPHNEAMIAFLMAYKHTGDEVHLEKFAEVFDYSYSHFVDIQRGEWFGYLSREGNVKIDAKGGAWKGCFHVPRALMMCEMMLHDILHKK